MIRVTVSDEVRSIDIRTDAPYSPDVLEDMVTRTLLARLVSEQTETS